MQARRTAGKGSVARPGAPTPEAVASRHRVAYATAIRVEIVRNPADQVGFAVHPRSWVVERFFAWLGRNRCLAKDFETSTASAQAYLYAASVTVLLRRLARSVRVQRQTLSRTDLAPPHRRQGDRPG